MNNLDYVRKVVRQHRIDVESARSTLRRQAALDMGNLAWDAKYGLPPVYGEVCNRLYDDPGPDGIRQIINEVCILLNDQIRAQEGPLPGSYGSATLVPSEDRPLAVRATSMRVAAVLCDVLDLLGWVAAYDVLMEEDQ